MSLRMYKQIGLGVAVLLAAGIGAVYFIYLRQPPPDDVLAANRAKHQTKDSMSESLQLKQDIFKVHEDDDYYYYDDDDVKDSADTIGKASPGGGGGGGGGSETEATKARRTWLQWVEAHDLISIGALYDKCDEGGRIMCGQVLMMKDHDTGGLMTRTIVNATLENEVKGGTMSVISYYNGKELYSNSWELCESEADLAEEDRIIKCPFHAGLKYFQKDVPIPGYLPKGTYKSRAWVTDLDDKEIGCSITEFTL